MAREMSFLEDIGYICRGFRSEKRHVPKKTGQDFLLVKDSLADIQQTFMYVVH